MLRCFFLFGILRNSLFGIAGGQEVDHTLVKLRCTVMKAGHDGE